MDSVKDVKISVCLGPVNELDAALSALDGVLLHPYRSLFCDVKGGLRILFS